MKIRVFALLMCVAGCLLFGSHAFAQQREDVTFQVNYNQTVVGQSVFVLGNLPELGGSDIRKAVKLEPSQWPIWKATVSLPRGVAYSYQYYRRDDGPGRLGDQTNQLAIGTLINATTSLATFSPPSKAVLYHSALSSPVLHWRTGSSGVFTDTPMVEAGAGRNASERRWAAMGVGNGERVIEFYFSAPDGSSRDPSGSAVYSTRLDGIFVQDANVYSYVPAPAVNAWRSDYSTSNLPSIFSTNLNETRRYRVVLPRGYNQHTSRRYPVVYLHDGQNVFESGPFGTWNAHISAGTLTAGGQMRECILVGVDNGPNRISDYSAPDAGGWGDRYVRFLRDELMPVINAQYRTLTGPDNTAAIGSSMGGHISLYMGWDYTANFARIGAFSGAFQISSSGFYNRVQSQPKRNIRLYLDSGDAGAANDNYWPIFNLRDNLLNPARASGSGAYALERDLKHVIGLGQQHNEAAWAARLPDAYRFLMPAYEDQGQLLPLATGAIFDVSADGQPDIDDLYAWFDAPVDINLDGVADLADAAFLGWYLRRNEPADMSSGNR